MRTAAWEQSTGALAALLNSGAPLHMADLYTITLASGTVLRWSGADVAVTAGSTTWALGPGIQRTGVRFVVGVEVDTLTLTLTDNAGTTIAGLPLLAWVRAGGLAGAYVELYRAFWTVGDTSPRGTLLWFPGRVSAITKLDRYSAQIQVKSPLELLDVMVPTDVYQPGCLNTLYDSATCGLARASFTSTGTTTSATDSLRLTFSHALAPAAGYFNMGTITFTSGANAGQSRTVRTHTSGSITVLSPWGAPVASGDAFSIVPGCDKTQAMCGTKFSNLAKFRGQPYIPTPETVL